MQLNSATNALLIIFTDMVVDGPDMKGVVPGRSEFEIPLSSASRKGRGEGTPADLPMSQIEKSVRDVEAEISHLEKTMAANAGFAMAGADFAKLRQPGWQSQLNQLAALRSRLIRLRMEPWRRWATGFSCFFFVLIGVPAAIVWRNGDFLSSFFKCFSPIVLFYYPVFMLVLDQSKSGGLPVASVWIPNLALVAPGLWIMRRMLKH
jgi:lipopolysaccharide export system permease protein